MTIPDWLRLREGAVKPGLSPHTRFVFLAGQPMYRLEVKPVGGGFVCEVVQTANGRRINESKICSDETSALAGGLELLKAQLGW